MEATEINLKRLREGQAVTIELDGRRYCVCREGDKLIFFKLEGKR